MKEFIFSLVVIVGTTACQSKSRESAAKDSSTIQVADTSISDSKGVKKTPIARYEGTIPCADCSGIKMELTLNVDNTYNLKETYLGKGDNVPIETSGNLNIERGFEKDIDATLLILDYDKPGKERYFVRLTAQSGLLQMLGRDKKLIQSKLNYSLKKIG